MSRSRLVAALATCAVVAGGTGTALAQGEGESITVTVGPRIVLTPGDTAPGSAPGVRAIRRGKPIPRGYRLVGREVSGVRGGVGAAIRFTCPGSKRLKSFVTTGQAGFQATRDYENRRSTIIVSLGGRGDGTVYAVCR